MALLSPQAKTRPSTVTKRLCEEPNETAAMHSPRSAATGVGTVRLSVSPCPSRPAKPLPNVYAPSSLVSTAQ
eukprot:5987803-Prymnesium_polylepis.1